MGLTALLLAALLLGSGGPGLAATAGRRSARAPAGGVADQVQADPIADLALELDYDLDAIFRFVADEIAYEPYPGILRGALGTLQARAGNSADKALLLAALLDASLIRYRFARGAPGRGRVRPAARRVAGRCSEARGASRGVRWTRAWQQLASGASCGWATPERRPLGALDPGRTQS